MRPRIRFLVALAIVSASIVIPASMSGAGGQAGGAAAKRGGINRYIVRMVDRPAASYGGDIRALAATKPLPGTRIGRHDQPVVAYAAYLDRRHDEVLGRVGGGRKVYDYRYSFNGFTAEMTDAQAAALKLVSGIVSVTKDELRHINTSSTPRFLGLDDGDGLWHRVGGPEHAGEDIVIGVIDSGVWPESESFSDRHGHFDDWAKRGRHDGKGDDEDEDGVIAFDDKPKWTGACEVGEAFSKKACNRKLIGARHFNEAWGGDAGLKEERPWEYASPRDYNGHGTHTSSTAGGNRNVVATGPAKVFGRISGMAPRARIAVYKALWSTEDGATASGFTSDLVAAIDQAVADGVDVINYSISGSSDNFLDPAEVSFLFAADAGVFVSAAAGNDGPTGGTVEHPSPWITTVAAGTHNRTGNGAVTLGSLARLEGPSLAAADVPFKPLILSTAAKRAGVSDTAARLCFSAADNNGVPALDPAKVAGKIVICDRGTNGRTSKSLAVRDAGGAGMILVNVSPNTVNADLHFVPTVHLSDTDGALVKTYAAATGAKARIAHATLSYDVPAPFVASFSSRGPLGAGNGDLLKPDVVAPGQDIVAAVAPPGNGGLSFNMYSGTSMATPHVAGLAALLMQLHGDWTPMMIKSALMTSASDVLDGPNTDPAVVFSQGAGHVAPNEAASPGLVYDSGFNDWLAFLCGATTGVEADTCAALTAAGYSLDPRNLNVASIGIGAMAGSQTVTRVVTNVERKASTYTPKITGLSGIAVSVTPASLRLDPGQRKAFKVTFTRGAAPLNAYAAGQLTWSDGKHRVRVPLIVRPIPLAAPLEVSGSGGPISYTVKFGYSGPFMAAARGLVAATTQDGIVADDPTDSFEPGGPGTVAIPVTIPAGTTHARFSIFAASVTPGSDLDLYLFKGTTLVGLSGTSTSNEQIDLADPVGGNDYILYVHGFAAPPSGASFKLYSWMIGAAAAGNMTVTAPATATNGATATIGLSFSGLVSGKKYLGSVAYSGTPGLLNPTLVRVDVP